MIASLRGVALCFVLLVTAVTVTATPTTAQRVDAGGAPPPGSGDVDVKGYVRVIDGDTIEVAVGGSRMGVGLIGINAPPVNTECGRAASDALRALSAAGLHLKEEPGLYLDERGRRLYRAITPGGRSVAQELVARGLVRVGSVGQEHDALVAAAAEAEAAARGCIRDDQQNRPRKISRLRTTSPDQSVAAAEPTDQAPGVFSAAALAAAPAGSSTPNGFVEQVVAGGLEGPTALGFIPDGRILVAEKRGVVRIVKNGAVLPDPFIDLRDRVNDYWDRGMLGLAVDPSFPTTGHVYLLYVYENDDGAGPYPGGYTGTKTARLTRVTASGDHASPSSEVVILGQQVGRSCSDFPADADCLPADGDGHSVGAIRFAPDGTLFASLGDASNTTTVDDRALRAQSLNSLAGKILHVGKDGRGLSSNPFWNGNANAIRSKVWAVGLRNPFRFSLRPGTSIPYVGDVGWSTWEEINVAVPGANFGWPCFEGAARQAGYEPKPTCQDLYNQGPDAVRAPLIAYQHAGGGASATGGVFYTGTSYPAAYQGAYLFADYTRSWIRTATVDANHILTGGPNDFVAGANSPVDLALGPDGRLYYVAFGSDDIRRLVYPAGEPPQNRPPTASATTTPATGPAPLTVQFTSAGSTDPDGDSLTYQWSFGDGTLDVTGPSPTHTYAANGAYTATLTVSDGRGGVATATRAVLVGANPCPTGQFSAEYFGNAALTGSPVLTRCEPSVNNRWGTASPAPQVPADNFSARWTGRYQFAAGEYTFTLVSDDGLRVWIDGVLVHDYWYAQPPVAHYVTRNLHEGLHEIKVEYFDLGGGAVAQVTWVAESENLPPTATINTPTLGQTFQVGDTITFSGSAIDREDGPLSPDRLRWNVILHHCPGWGSDCHAHPLTSVTGEGGSFVAPDHGDGMYFQVELIATDGGGRAGTTSVSLQPRTIDITLDTSPSGQGLQLVFGGQQAAAPMVRRAVVGSRQTIHAPSPQDSWRFDAWSDGGAQQHEIVAGSTDMTILASYSLVAGAPTITPTPTPTPTVVGTSAPPGSLVKGINIGGPEAVTIGGQQWQSYPQALADGLTVSSGANTWVGGTYPVPLQPPPDANTQTMLQSALWRTVSAAGQGFQLQQTLPNGAYDVYVTFGENFRANYRALNVRLEGATAATDLGSLPLGGWARYGPFRAQVADGALTIDIVRGSRGDPHLMGLEIFAAGATFQDASATTPTPMATATPSATAPLAATETSAAAATPSATAPLAATATAAVTTTPTAAATHTPIPTATPTVAPSPTPTPAP